MKKIIVFFESYNDVDNIMPFIDYLLSNNKAKVTIYKSKRSNLSGCEDYLKYLKSTYNLSPVYFDENFSKLYNLFFSLYRNFRNISLKAKTNSLFLPVIILNTRVFRPFIKYLTRVEVYRSLSSLDADTIMMDEGKEGSFFASFIVNYCKNNTISVVGFPHGFTIYTNSDPQCKDRAKRNRNTIKSLLLKLAKPAVKKSYFDRYLTVPGQKDTFYSTSMLNFDAKYLNRVYEVGSMRFTHEWISKLRKDVITPKNFSYGDKSRTNVVVFMSNPRYNVNITNLVTSLKTLSEFNKINLVIKPHTRSLFEGMEHEKICGYDATKISSSELSLWADVGIVYGSSIAFQLIMDNVPIIMPRYFHTNSTLLEENDACIVVDDLDSLMHVLSKPVESVNNMINQSKRKNLIDYYVYGGNVYSEFMDRFYKLVVGQQ